MKTPVAIKMAALAAAFAATGAFAEDAANDTAPVGGESPVNGVCHTCTNAIPAFAFPSIGDIDAEMKKLENDPDAKIERDENGNIKSVRVTRSCSKRMEMKDGKVVLTEENYGNGDDALAPGRANAMAGTLLLNGWCREDPAKEQEIAELRKELAELKAQIDALKNPVPENAPAN